MAALDVDHVPAPQLTQTSAEVASTTDDHVPATQFLQDDDVPLINIQVPAVHVEPHDPDDDAPLDAEYVPATQLAHDPDDVAPTLAEYVPATQF